MYRVPPSPDLHANFAEVRRAYREWNFVPFDWEHGARHGERSWTRNVLYAAETRGADRTIYIVTYWTNGDVRCQHAIDDSLFTENRRPHLGLWRAIIGGFLSGKENRYRHAQGHRR